MSRSVRRQIVFVGVFLVVVLLFVTLFRMGLVRGDSMSPTYEDGQVVLVQRRSRFSPPLKHNDVILVRHDRDVLIKRVYRLEGEELTTTFPYYGLTPGLRRLLRAAVPCRSQGARPAPVCAERVSGRDRRQPARVGRQPLLWAGKGAGRAGRRGQQPRPAVPGRPTARCSHSCPSNRAPDTFANIRGSVSRSRKLIG